MSPSPFVALALLGIWIAITFAVTNAAAYNQWRAADRDTAGYYSPTDTDGRSSSSSVARDRRSTEAMTHDAPLADD